MRNESAALNRTEPERPAPLPQPAPRSERLRALASQDFDVLVIGGGVTGCGAARDAALRGLKVALVEREDFASGTSSRSSRLIHGGLRYLEHGHLGLVFESSIERMRLLKLAPHLVRPLAFVWPVYEGARVPRWKLNAGLMLYDALALFRNVKGYQGLNAREVQESEPGLRPEGLKGGARYYDAATDDARLTLANALGASEAGATLVNHASVLRLVVEEGQARGAVVVDHLTGQELTMRARVLVNATGPWSDEIRRLDAQGETHAVRGSKGVHIEVPRARLGNREALTLLSPVDGRVMFILPAGPHTIIGTTETATHAHPAEVRATEADVKYLIESANGFFPNAHLTREDVISAWAGIRPLVSRGYSHGGNDAGSASREHAIDVSPTGVLAISGGKLTTFRVMARDVVNAVEKHLGRPHHKPATVALPLPGGDMPSFEAELAAANPVIGQPALAEHLVRFYGTRWRGVWALVGEDASLGRPLAEGLPYLRAEAAWGVTHEFVHSLSDLLVRRLKVAFETRDLGRAAAREAAEVMAPLLGWSADETQARLAAYEEDVRRLFGVDASEG